jgi:hypothetical protein
VTADLEKLVKPLVFTKRGAEWWSASSFGFYIVAQGIHDAPNAWGMWQPSSDVEDDPDAICEGEREGIAAAQADYARRIAAALDPDAVARMVQEAVKAEREACARMIETSVAVSRRDLAALGLSPSAEDERAVNVLKLVSAAIRARGEA